MPTLYIVATPIGNLKDITYRAVEILKEVDLILCEDTRMTKKLLDTYGIGTQTASYNSKSTVGKKEYIFSLLEEGKNIALVSDAGTPTISDPGVLIVSQVREHFGERVAVIPIPGPSALIAALSASGSASSEFTFLGFLPHKKGRETLFKEIAASKRTMVLYESPHRIGKTLESFEKYFAPDRKIIIARELTKIYEQFVIGTPEEVKNYFISHPDKARGEFVVIVEGKKERYTI